MQEGYKEKQNPKWENYLDKMATIKKENDEHFKEITRRIKK